MQVDIDLGDAVAFKREMDRIGRETFRQSVKNALSEAAVDARDAFGKRLEQDVEGGPAKFTRVGPGSASSVVANPAKGRSGGAVESSIRVQKKQSAYLAFGLGEDDVRTPGEAGFSTKSNLFPTDEGSGLFKLKRDAQGNVSRQQVRKLFKQVDATEEADKKRLLKQQQQADAAALAAERAKRLAKRKRDQKTYSALSVTVGPLTEKKAKRLANVERRLTRAKDALFIVKDKRGRGLAPGIWQRDYRGGRAALLLSFAPKSRYPKAGLVEGWNESVLAAADAIPKALDKALSERETLVWKNVDIRNVGD